MVGEMVCCLSWFGMVSELGLLSWAQDETGQVYLDMDSTPSSIATSVDSAYVSPNDPNEILVRDVEVDVNSEVWIWLSVDPNVTPANSEV